MGENANKSLNTLLDEYLDDVRRKLQSNGPKTAGAEAAFVGLSPGHWSRLRNGKAMLTPEAARRIADAIGQVLDQKPAALERELLAAHSVVPERRDADQGPQAVYDLFERISHERATLFISYGTPPNTMLHGPLSEIGVVTVEAIKKGMRLVLIQPFGPTEELGKLRQGANGASFDPRWEYRFHLAQDVRELFEEIRSQLDDDQKRRVICLEAAVVHPSAGTGLGTQLHYTEYGARSGRSSGTEMLQFLRGKDGKYHLISLYGDSSLQEAIQEELNPILKTWRRSRYSSDYTLPQDTGALHSLGGNARHWTIVQNVQS